jgi:hypothetical protein
MIVLFSISILLFIISFFMNDPVKSLKEELDQLSIQMLQDTYQLKKKVRILEEELLVPETNIPEPVGRRTNDIIKKQVTLLHMQGLSIEQIAKQSALTEEEVYSIIQENE